MRRSKELAAALPLRSTVLVLLVLALLLLPVAVTAATTALASQGAVQGLPGSSTTYGLPAGSDDSLFADRYLDDDGQYHPFRAHINGSVAPYEANQASQVYRAPQVITNTNWTNLWPTLFAVSAISSTDAWAVGEYGYLLHYTGTAWSIVDAPVMRGSFLSDIEMLSARDGWISAGDRAFQYNGTSWRERSNGLSNSGLVLRAVSPVASDDVWATGNDYSANRFTLAHWDGTAWTTAGPVLTWSQQLMDIEMTSASDGWAVGFDYTVPSGAGIVLHYNGSGWSYVPAPPDAFELFAISSAVPGEVWVAGVGGGPDYLTTMYRYATASGSWTAYPIPNTRDMPRGIFMLDATQGWAVTFNSILHWNGTSWTVEYSDIRPNGVSGVQGQVWTVGAAETIMSRTGGGPWIKTQGGPTGKYLYAVDALNSSEAWAVGETGAVLHYTGTWQLVQTPFTRDLQKVMVVSSLEAHVVGDRTIGRWNGSSWTQVATPSAHLYGLALLGTGEGWAVGSGGAIWRMQQGTWSEVPSPTTRNLYTVVMDSPDHGWAAGGDTSSGNRTPLLLEYDGANWIDRSSLLPSNSIIIRDIVLTAPSEGWAVGDACFQVPGCSPIWRLSGGVWSAVLLDPDQWTSLLKSISLDALGEAWAVGIGQYHHASGTWTYEELPTLRIQNGISLVPGRGGWSVGNGGSILHYNPLVNEQLFDDVPPDNPFYTFINYLAAHGIISGYADRTFRPFNNTTRGQLCKIVALAEGWNLITPPTPTFNDVPPDNPFYSYIETAYSHGVISGYSDDTFRPYNNVTRGQLCKIVVLAEGWTLINPPVPTFRDVPASDPFYRYIETAYLQEIISGYTCGVGCLEFRPGNNATRGQICKIVYNAITQIP